MKIHLHLLVLVLLISSLTALGQSRFWVEFTDKKNSPYTLSAPELFLSERSLERRHKQGIQVDSSDLPVSPTYIDSLASMGITPKHTSRWLNAISVETKKNKTVSHLTTLSFIKRIYPVAENTRHTTTKALIPASVQTAAQSQVEMLGGHILHNNGFKGADIHIAILDGGFYKAHENPILQHLFLNGQILETFDFEENDDRVYEDSDHGMKVLSALAGYQEGTFTGTAPEASYYLFRTEVGHFEQKTEEDNWIAAAEYADQLGVDIINTSLGYSVFDDPAENYTYQDMDGNTTAITRAADIAAAKGILVVVSAGNEGNSDWKYITAPADGDSVLTIGAIDENGTHASFSSIGPTYDGRIKPDVVALGSGTTVAGSSGSLIRVSGTSFSAPLIAGMSACLWQQYPSLTNWQLIERIRTLGSNYPSPNNFTGYGIPNFASASGQNTTITQNSSPPVRLHPNPFTKEITLKPIPTGNKKVSIKMYTLDGVVKWEQEIPTSHQSSSITFTPHLPSGLYIVVIKGDRFSFQQKLMKE